MSQLKFALKIWNNISIGPGLLGSPPGYAFVKRLRIIATLCKSLQTI